MKDGPSINQWNRTSPVAVIFFLFNTIRQFALNALPAVAIVIATYASASDGRKALMAAGLLLAILLGALLSVVHWLRFRFRVTSDRVLVKSGIFNREELTVEFGRIQNVSIREPFYMRPFGLALLAIDTAGSGKKEINLSGIPKALALELRNTMLAKTSPPTSMAQDQEDNRDPEPVLLSRSSKDIVIYGLTANFMLWVAIAVGTFFSTFDVKEEVGIWMVDHFDPEAAGRMVVDGLGVPIVVVIVVSVLLLIFVGLPLISIIGALFRHHGYQLRVDGETYRKSSGLLTRFDESLKRHKIQAMVLKQNWIASFFKRTNMQLRVASAGSGIENGEISFVPKASFQVPALDKEELALMAQEFFPACALNNVQFSKINRGRLAKVVIGWAVLPPLVIVTTIFSVLINAAFALMFPLVLALSWIIINQVWKKIGYGVVGDYGFIRKGFIGTQTTVFPMFKVQRVDIRQTPGQRRKGLAQLSIHLASHSLKIPYVSVADAKQFRDLALYHVESSKQAWY